MITLLPSQPPAYVLVEGLRESSAVASASKSLPDEWTREELLLRKLGPRGWGRVYHFRNYYASGWGSGCEGGHVLSPRALDAFFRFVENTTFPPNCNPSVFLTDRGGIELCWEDRERKSVQVEFTGLGAEFYLASKEQEGFLQFDRLAELSKLLSA